MHFMPQDIDYLLSPRAIRERSGALYEHALAGRTHFRVNEDRLPAVARLVADITLENYPDLRIPFHSRWGHFQVGGVDRLGELGRWLNARAKGDARERARCKFDLVMTSVLLDAGAGMAWRYVENSCAYSRSEGLAVASFRMFLDGELAPERLPDFSAVDLERGFQVSSENPLQGVEGRAGLIRALGKIAREDTAYFPGGRLGGLADFLFSRASKDELPAREILGAVLRGLGPIWPGRIALGNVNLGDVWSHPLLAFSGDRESVRSLIPFHKLSQWLSYSLIEPLEEAGLKVVGVDELTGLAEYRNGGLILDEGLIELRDPALARQTHAVDSELVIEWRALTVVLLDRIAEEVRGLLKRSREDFPLAKVLEGGTWRAGRKSAARLRPDAGPPLKVHSDGTVF